MTIMGLIKKEKEDALEQEKIARGEQDPPQPLSPETSLYAKQQLWIRCEACGATLYIQHLKDFDYTCKDCGATIPMGCQERVEFLIDADTWRPINELLSPVDPLKFVDSKPYTQRLAEAQERTGMQDAVVTGTGLLHGHKVALGVMNFEFMGGSMGSVVGEKITRLIEHATDCEIPVILVSSSGGARMQEGAISLMQMAKIAGALHNHQTECNLMYISVLASPTTGGVTASFGMLGNFNFAEPQATIGFAGRRVIEQTLNITLPPHFQTAEHLLAHGMLDDVIPRKHLKGALGWFLGVIRDAPFRRRGKSI
jgi:acetyl-CoA carboxylase carboxyl transferase subunit beta